MRLSQLEPGGGLGQWDEVEAGMAPVPQHGVDTPMQWQAIDDEIGVAGRSKAFQPIEKLEPCGSHAAVSRGALVSIRTCPVRCAKAPKAQR